MITTEKMAYVTGVFLEEDNDSVTRVLLKLGVLDLVDIRKISPTLGDRLKAMPPTFPTGRLDELIKKIDTLFGAGGTGLLITPPESIEIMDQEQLEQDEQVILALGREIETHRKQIDNLAAERHQLDEIRRQFDMFGSIRAGIQAQSAYSFLSIRTGTLPEGSTPRLEEALSGIPSVILPASEDESPVYLIITLKKDDGQTKAILDRLGWQNRDLPSRYEGKNNQLQGTLEQKLSRFREEEEEVSSKIKQTLDRERSRLVEIRSRAVAARLAGRIQSFFARTERTTLFSGWVPARERGHLEKAVRTATSGRCYTEWSDEKEMRGENITAPVKLSNPHLLRPFEKLVTNYGVPEYGTIDPTPFVAVSYFMMFGLMFGDAGHGIILALIGFLGIFLGRRKKRKTNLFELITWCGVSAILAGILFGSFFGFELFPPLWFDYHAVVFGRATGGTIGSIFDILGITIYFGIAVIGTGILLNWVNLVIKKRWFLLVFDKGGILGGWIYAAGIMLAFYFVRHEYRQLPPVHFIIPALLVPLLILAAKPPLEFRMRRSAGKAERFSPITIIVFMMEWVVEVLEISSGYLANTLSFMRVAGLGIAHVSLMSAFFQIADMASGGQNLTAGSIIILILGNLLVIGLEGLSAGIQSLRLNYYEFFSKYFSSTGRAYTPVSLEG